MGPFALMDLIGHDVNEAVTRSVWTAFGYDPRFEPSLSQRALVEAGRLGRKTGRGFFDYSGGATPAPAPAATGCTAPAAVVELGTAADLRALLGRAGVAVLAGQGGGGLAELPSGALLTRCDGRTATELSVVHRAPVVVIDRSLDDAAATAVAIAASDGATVQAVHEAN